MLGKNSHFTACSDMHSASNTQIQYMNIVYSEEKFNWISACPVPCQQTSYAAHPTYFHKTSMLNLNTIDVNSSALLTINYATLGIKEHVESFVYDAGSFLAAAGGNLGLFLGFSCLSLFSSILNYLKNVNF